MASRQELVLKILEKLGVAQAGQDLPPEDYEAVNRHLDTRLLAMTRQDIFRPFDVDDEVPDEAVDLIADYLAEKYIAAFGLLGEEAANLKLDAQAAERSLRYLRAGVSSGAPVRADYF